MKHISKTVWLLSLVSLFTDLASEMLYPVMPLYLKEIGFSILFIGIIEGLVEAISGLSKSIFGQWSDKIGKRMPFVQAGYALSAISKPLLAIFTSPLGVLLARSTDRLGKGIRSAPRDALLNAEATGSTRGHVFGFHRALDTLGAVLGPCLALIYLFFFPGNYIQLFWLAFIPGIISVGFTYFIPRETTFISNNKKISFKTLWTYGRKAGNGYKRATLLMLLFALFNSSDVFLLLRLKDLGASNTTVVGSYIFYNLVFALLSFPMGKWSDKVGKKAVFISGLGVFVCVYFGMAMSTEVWQGFIWLLVYGCFAAMTDGVSKAWIGQYCEKAEAGLGYGSFMAKQSILIMVASSCTGMIWMQWGPVMALSISAIGAALVLFLSGSKLYWAERE